MRKLLVKMAVAAALVVGAHVCMRDSYDVNTVRGYFESALEMGSSFDGKTTRCSLAVDSAERTELVRLVGEKNSLRLLGKEKSTKYVIVRHVTLRLSESREVSINMIRFPCLVVDGHTLAASKSLYRRLVEGGKQ